jgi:SnoaL-like domain
MTGVAVRQDGTWRLVQLHVSAAVPDKDLLAD